MTYVIQEVEGQRCSGGALYVTPLVDGDELTLLEIRYPAGVATGEHAHGHESVVYVVEGRLSVRIEGRVFVLGPGQACRHPAGVLHSVKALEDARVVEVKAPPPDLGAVFCVSGGEAER